MSALFLVVILFICLAMGVPVAISLGLASISTILLFADQTLLSLSQRFFHTTQIYPLLAVPFFILAATFMTTGGVAKRMIDFANALVGHFRGGLAMAALLACAFFSAVSGSAPADRLWGNDLKQPAGGACERGAFHKASPFCGGDHHAVAARFGPFTKLHLLRVAAEVGVEAEGDEVLVDVGFREWPHGSGSAAMAWRP